MFRGGSDFIQRSGQEIWVICSNRAGRGILLIFVVIHGEYLSIGILCPNLFLLDSRACHCLFQPAGIETPFLWGTT